MDGDPTPALTGRRRTRPTSIGCRNPWQPKPGRAPLIAAQAAVQTNRATSDITCHKPEGAFYAFPNIARCIGKTSKGGRRIATDTDFVTGLLEEQHVAAVQG